jgi:hypothetical protein
MMTARYRKAVSHPYSDCGTDPNSVHIGLQEFNTKQDEMENADKK